VEVPDVKWSDIGGMDELKLHLKQVRPAKMLSANLLFDRKKFGQFFVIV
jgi:SpoVK/Ycf46/Vps4 family AAA+-type ATPase